ncbi:MAG: lactate/malate family dehydrogenase [Acetivibrio ethanolgignens]
MKLTLLGAAGGIGQPLSMILKNNLPAGSKLSLFDVAPFTHVVATD